LSSIVTDKGIVHYEVDGRGKPLVFLHGWLGSWDVWRDTMRTISGLRQYKIYALDFWGFGDSAKKSASFFTISSYVFMVDQFMEIMGIAQAPVIGHSMGGTVAMNLALEHPSRVEKVIVIGSPMIGSSLNILLKLAGHKFIAYLVWNNLDLLRLGLRIFSSQSAKDGQKLYSMIKEDLSRTTVEAFRRSIASLREINLKPYLSQIQVPTLAIYGKKDNIVHPSQARIIGEQVRGARVEWMNGSKHFPMLDEPEQFTKVLLDFLAS
jgi:pimeloyl-ACP methyl ester carboxylesterase